MKTKPCFRKHAALTLLEALVLIVLLAVLASMLLPALMLHRRLDHHITCVNNLKQVGIAYRLWAGDNGGHFPAQTSTNSGGMMEMLARPDAAQFYWTNYVIMGNEFGQSPRVLICPLDERVPAASFADKFSPTDPAPGPYFDNTHISYFAGPDASDEFPQSILGGDRNLGPGPEAKNDYGWSPPDGRGRLVRIFTNTPVTWSLKMHSDKNKVGAGNLLLGDGSAQQASSAATRRIWLFIAQIGTNAAQRNAGFRLVFP